MPRVNPAELAPSQIYGKTKVDNSLTFGERLRKRFRPADTVKVHNVTNAAIEWQWLDPEDETYSIEDGSNVKIVEREDPQLWRLGAGEIDILTGSCAYLMIEALYKQTCAMKTGIVLHPLSEREIRNFAFDDPEKQEEFIDMVFQGKVTPQMMQEAAISSFGGDFKPKVLEHLPALATEEDEFTRRTAAEQAEQKRRVHGKPAPTELSDLADEAADFLKPATGQDEAPEEAGEEVQTEPEKPAVVKPLNRSKVVKEKQPVA